MGFVREIMARKLPLCYEKDYPPGNQQTNQPEEPVGQGLVFWAFSDGRHILSLSLCLVICLLRAHISLI
jgi:hypothetical protein